MPQTTNGNGKAAAAANGNDSSAEEDDSDEEEEDSDDESEEAPKVNRFHLSNFRDDFHSISTACLFPVENGS